MFVGRHNLLQQSQTILPIPLAQIGNNTKLQAEKETIIQIVQIIN